MDACTFEVTLYPSSGRDDFPTAEDALEGLRMSDAEGKAPYMVDSLAAREDQEMGWPVYLEITARVPESHTWKAADTAILTWVERTVPGDFSAQVR